MINVTRLSDRAYGYKVFNPDWSCNPREHDAQGQYTCPARFEDDEMDVQKRGMTFRTNPIGYFKSGFYKFDSNTHVVEVIAYGDIGKSEHGTLCWTNKLEIVRELSWEEVLSLVNIGKDCTGIGNTGECNTGNYNSGSDNEGDRNVGYYNSGRGNVGDHNTGDHNTGNHNSSYDNTGHYNSGYRNSGDYNAGCYNTGKSNTGDYNIGNYNDGDYNTGDQNTGHHNTGRKNVGDSNTGYENTGNNNTGNNNRGKSNTGNYNSGNYNTGNRNIGNRNTGDWNLSAYNNGCFNTEETTIMLFNKPSNWTYSQWLKSRACHLLNDIPNRTVEWIGEYSMTAEEKELNPGYETVGGYLKVFSQDENRNMAQKWWDELDDSEKKTILSIPNFDADIFYKCTGVNVQLES